MRAVTCCDIHCDVTTFGVQTRNRRSKPVALLPHLQNTPTERSAQYLVLSAQPQYTDLPHPRIFKACTNFLVPYPWFCDQNEKL